MACKFDGKEDKSSLGSGDSCYYANFLFDAEETLKVLEGEIDYVPRSELIFKIYGKSLTLPRDKQFYGDIEGNVVPLYRYGGGYIPKIKEWTDTLRNIRDKVNEKTGQYCNHAVINRYINGNDHIGFHRDKNKDFIDNTNVMTVSLGCPRKFILRHDKTGVKQEIYLKPGSLMILGPKTNKEWKHSIPKRSVNAVKDMRLSITLRSIKTKYNMVEEKIV